MPRTERPERRHAPRRTPAADEPLSQVRLRAGRELLVIDISAAGVKVEGVMRLLPGTYADVHLVTTQGRLLVRSRIVRAYVHRVSAGYVLYRGALAFERPVDTASGYAIPSTLAGPAGA